RRPIGCPIATNIARGARNRPDHLGGPQLHPTDEGVLAECLARTGIGPKLVGERVIDAIRNRTFYTFVSAVPVDVIKARHRRIEAALETPRSGPPGTCVRPASETRGRAWRCRARRRTGRPARGPWGRTPA